MSVCLDACALLCWLQDESGAEVVEHSLAAGSDEPEARPRISLMNLGAVLYRLARTLPLLTGDPEMKSIESQEPLEIRWWPMKPQSG